MALTRLGPNQSINLATNTTGTLGVANGGTGLTSGTSGQFLKFTGSTTVASAAVDAGKIAQVVQDSHEAETNVTSDSFTGINLSVNITPSATSSKVLVMVSLEGVGQHSGGTGGACRITKGGSELKQFTNSSADDNNTSENFYASSETCVYIDSPSSTSQLTYAVEAKRRTSSGAWRMNAESSSFSSITVWEILA